MGTQNFGRWGNHEVDSETGFPLPPAGMEWKRLASGFDLWEWKRTVTFGLVVKEKQPIFGFFGKRITKSVVQVERKFWESSVGSYEFYQELARMVLSVPVEVKQRARSVAAGKLDAIHSKY